MSVSEAGCSPKRAIEHLGALGGAHLGVLSALASMRETTRELLPDPVSICRGRWNVSRAARRRWTVVDVILADLLIDAGASDAAALQNLRNEDIALTQDSARHVQSWTAERIVAEWPLYCAKFAVIQTKVERRIREEAELLGAFLKVRAGPWR